MLNNKLKYFLSFILLLTYSLISFSTETILKGKIENFNGKKLKIGRYKDFITSQKEWIGSCEIENNTFSIHFDISQTSQIILKIEDKETSLFAEAGAVYNISLSYDETANQDRAFDKFLDLKMLFPQPNETNQLIKKFNTDYQNFMAKNFRLLVVKGGVKETKAFIDKWKKKSRQESNSFVANYVKYAIANLEDIGRTSRDTLFDSYLKEAEILYNQKEYFNFFIQFYRGDFAQLALKSDAKEFLKAIMLENDFDKSRNEIARLKKIENPALAELYLMNGLFEVFHKKTINQQSSLDILKTISEKGTTPGNKKIALSILQELENYGKDQLAPSFALKDVNGQTINLSDFKGKVSYLSFWSNSSIPSLREMRVMQSLVKKYGKKINFVSINIDDDASIFKKIQEKNQYQWPFLHIGDQHELKEKYKVRTIPSYFLIDENGNFMQTFAPNPVEIDRTLYELSK